MASKFENIFNDEFPEILEKILQHTGFDSTAALIQLNSERITGIEEFINKNRTALRELFVGTFYEFMNPFMFLPGHRALLESLPDEIEKNSGKEPKGKSALSTTSNHFSLILRHLIDTAQHNTDKNPKAFRYPEIIRVFATYLYLICGKAAYEVLSANLPLPTANTASEYLEKSRLLYRSAILHV